MRSALLLLSVLIRQRNYNQQFRKFLIGDCNRFTSPTKIQIISNYWESMLLRHLVYDMLHLPQFIVLPSELFIDSGHLTFFLKILLLSL